MSQEQYNTLLSNLLKEKRALTKLRVELEERKGEAMSMLQRVQAPGLKLQEDKRGREGNSSSPK